MDSLVKITSLEEAVEEEEIKPPSVATEALPVVEVAVEK